MQSKNVLIIAAEDSSAIYACRFISEWKKLNLNQNTHFWGIGSQDMVNLGFEALYSPKEMAVVGLTEVISHYSRIKSILFEIKNRAIKDRPDFILLLDYPEFNLRLAEECHKAGLKVIYWIPPQVWAWRKSRIKKIKKYVDTVISVFPFEHEFYLKNGVRSHFFGHPLKDFMKEEYFDSNLRKMRRAKAGISEETFVVGLMPGSRRSEIDQHFELMLKAADLIYQKNKKSVFLIPVAPSVEIDEIKSRLGNSSVPIIIQKRQPEDVIDLMDFVIVASGTATLLVALLQKPMIILYKMNPVTAWLLSHIVRGVKFFGLPNLISNKQIAPELFQAQVTPEQIEQLFLKWQQDLAYQNQVKQDLLSLREKLGANQSVITDVVKFLSKF